MPVFPNSPTRSLLHAIYDECEKKILAIINFVKVDVGISQKSLVF